MNGHTASKTGGSPLGDALHDVGLGGARATSSATGVDEGLVVVGRSMDVVFAENIAQEDVRGARSGGGAQRLGGGPFGPV